MYNIVTEINIEFQQYKTLYLYLKPNYKYGTPLLKVSFFVLLYAEYKCKEVQYYIDIKTKTKSWKLPSNIINQQNLQQ